jgi:predicted N-acetyltransferase YhbS
LNRYHTRRAESSDDAKRLHALFSDVFHPEDVGTLAETIFHHLPHMKLKYWFLAEETTTAQIVSAFALIPWIWELEGVKLHVAEMGIVGTQQQHRGQGLMRTLNKEFDSILNEEKFDLAVIQGIPGFYHRFGYHYAIPLENHVNLPLHLISKKLEPGAYSFRPASIEDIPYLLQEDQTYRNSVSLSVFRDAANWTYLLTESMNTEYGSEYWIMEDQDETQRFYCRIPKQGFGTGLILSEISENITYDAFHELLGFCSALATERKQPYIRFNLHNHATASRFALSMGAHHEKCYAWQIKIPDTVHLLTTMKPLLEKRIRDTVFNNFSGTLRLNFFTETVDLCWNKGNLIEIAPGEGECGDTFSINSALFPALCLGYRTWQEIRHLRKDIFPSSNRSRLLIETLFPSRKSWIYEQY